MRRAAIIERLRRNTEAVKSLGATSLFLFGSVARDDATEASDVDLFIDYDETSRFSLIDLIAIKQFLEDQMSMDVDIATRDSLNPMLRREIERSAVRVF